MKLWSVLTLALVTAAGLPAVAAENETAPALHCLLDTGPNQCGKVFVARASMAARPWIYPNQNLRFSLGPLDSATYVHSLSGSQLYRVGLINWDGADVYDVKFQHQEKTFYISPPEADGKIRYLAVHDGSPEDDMLDGPRG